MKQKANVEDVSIKMSLGMVLKMSGFLFIVGAICAQVTHAEVETKSLCLKGCPKDANSSNKQISRSIYVLSNNPGTKFADWAAYKVSKKNFSCKKRANAIGTSILLYNLKKRWRPMNTIIPTLPYTSTVDTKYRLHPSSVMRIGQ